MGPSVPEQRDGGAGCDDVVAQARVLALVGQRARVHAQALVRQLRSDPRGSREGQKVRRAEGEKVRRSEGEKGEKGVVSCAQS